MANNQRVLWRSGSRYALTLDDSGLLNSEVISLTKAIAHLL
jgi:hypothetical protein